MRAQLTGEILAAAALAAMLAAPAPALAQKAKASAAAAAQILVTEANPPDAYTAVGALIVTVHPKSLSPKTPTRDLLDAELRKQAAKVGADAVIQVRYTLRNPMMSDKGSDAMGVAVKFNRVAAAPTPPSPALSPPPAASAPQVAAVSPPAAPAPRPAAGLAPPVAPRMIAPAPASAAPPPAPSPTQVAAAPVAPPQQIASAASVAAPPVAAAPVVAAPVVAAPLVAAPAAPVPVAPTPVAPTPVAPTPVAPNPVAPTPVAAPAPPVVRHATSLDMIVVTEQDFADRRYTRVGEVRSEVHQKSLFPKISAKDLLNADLRTQAQKLGADAVLQVKYDMHNALTSTQGDIATGVAVRYE